MISIELLSEELLSEVLNCNVEYFYMEGNILKYGNSYENFEINIYELTHRCKVWALSQGYYFELNICLSVVHLKLWEEVGITKLFKSFKRSKEIEVYYKACQWILENK